MKASHIEVLLIEDNAADAKILQQLLFKSTRARFEVRSANRLSTGLELLETGSFDIVLLDLALPDAQGLDTFRMVRSRFASIPIIVLTGLDDEAVAFEAVAAGAQDYLVKGQIPGGLLVRSILYALERNQTNEKIKQLNGELEDRIIQLAKANKELEEARYVAEFTCNQALQASNFKSQFVAKMSHEIRTPIAALISALDLLKMEESSSEKKELLRIADDSAHSLLDVIDDVLDLSKIEAGKVELQITDFSAVTLVEEVGDLFVPAAQKKGLRIMTFVDPRIPAILQGDQGRLKQILLNFTNNALKFTDQGKILLRMALESEDEEAVNVRLSVTDSGCGIADDVVGELFQPFVQLGNEHIHGTGLGLSICKLLVELMGGQIGVQSVAQQGSTFWISLRLNRSKTVPTEKPFHFEHAQQLLQSGQVLIITDNLMMREIIHDYVCAIGLRNNVAANSEEGLAMVRYADQVSDPYNLVLVNLEFSDALAFGSELNADPSISATPLVCISSARETSNHSEKIWQAGFSKNLREPIHQAELIDCIVGLLSKSPIGEPSKAQGTINIFVPNNDSKVARPITVLLAEDNEIIQKLIRSQLDKLGITMTAVANGREAISAFERGHFSLVLMDISMPEMNGLEAVRAIRRAELSTGHYTPIVALTAQTMTGDRERCLEAGMDDYLAKPVILEQLRQIIKRWTDGETVCTHRQGGHGTFKSS